MTAKANKPVTGGEDDKAMSQYHNVKVNTMSHNILEEVRKELKSKGMKRPSASYIIEEMRRNSKGFQIMCAKLQPFAGEHGENEGANDTLSRLLNELNKYRAKAHPA